MSAPLKVLLAGEGKNELGNWINEGPYRAVRGVRNKELPPLVGVLEALLRKVSPDGWVVTDAVAWKSLRKLQAGVHGHGDARNLEAALLRAKERRCDVVVFSRDRDGAKNRARQTEIDAIVTNAPTEAGSVRVVGAVAVETLEAWVLAFAGDAKCESYSNPGDVLCALRSIPPKDTTAMVAIVEADDASLKDATTRSPSLARWVTSARLVFIPAG